MNEPTKPEIWVCLDKDGYPVFTAGWKEACHEHINDAVLHDKSAGKWVVRQVTANPAKTESVLIENVAYTLPIEVACELLRLHIELKTAQKDAAWQPIECNPKDCIPFLAFAEYLIDMDFNPEGIVEACWDGMQFTGCVWNGQQDAWYGKKVRPTHWMPRPKPPKQEQVAPT